MSVTGQVEIAEGELVWEQVLRMRENGRGDRWCASDQITDGGSSVGLVHRVSHRSSFWDFAPRVFHVLSLGQPCCAATAVLLSSPPVPGVEASFTGIWRSS